MNRNLKQVCLTLALVLASAAISLAQAGGVVLMSAGLTLEQLN